MLKALVFMPVVGAAILAILPTRGRLLWQSALLFSLAALLWSLRLVSAFDFANPGFQFSISTPWNARLGSYFALGVDGLALSMVCLTALLTFVAILVSKQQEKGQRLYFSLILLLESAMFGVFTARDWALFYVFWEATLIPLFFLIDRLGGAGRQRAALNFFLYTLAGSVFILVSLLFLYDAAPGHSFAMTDMAAGGQLLPLDTQLLIFAGLLIGFGVKMPMFPLHGWLPLAHVEAPSAVSVLLSGVLLKMGAYGLIRSVEIVPDAALHWQDGLALLGAFSLFYGALLAWRQQDLKSMVAYSSISHMGLVLLGIATLNLAGLTGAAVQMVAHGLTAGALFMWVGALYQRSHTRNLLDYPPILATTPRLAFFAAFFLLTGVGFPGSAGFIAELHVLFGALQRYGVWGLLPALTVVLAAAYSLRAIGRLCLPSPQDGENLPGQPMQLSDLLGHEWLAASLLACLIVLFGLAPSLLTDLVAPSLQALVRGAP